MRRVFNEMQFVFFEKEEKKAESHLYLSTMVGPLLNYVQVFIICSLERSCLWTMWLMKNEVALQFKRVKFRLMNFLSQFKIKI